MELDRAIGIVNFDLDLESSKFAASAHLGHDEVSDAIEQVLSAAIAFNNLAESILGLKGVEAQS